jgi:hypothetical protein
MAGEGGEVLVDGFVEVALAREDHAEVRVGLKDVGVLLEQLAIVADGGRVIAALLGGYGIAEELLGAGVLRGGGAGQKDQ